MPRTLMFAVLLLFAASLLAQSTSTEKKITKATKATKSSSVSEEQVDPDDMVILIPGACHTEPLEFATRDCIRGVTRHEFEDLVAAVKPDATPEFRQRLAESLGQIIVLSNEAKKRGIVKDPEVQQLVRFQQLQILANLLVSQSLKQEAAQVSDADIQAYYHQHISDYESAELVRLEIPAKGGANADDDMRFAETIHARCGNEDPAKLQTEADARVGRPVAPPADLKNQSRDMFTAAQQSVFDLKPGQCSEVIRQNGGFLLYKMVATTVTPLPRVRDAIANALQRARTKTELDELRKQNVISLNQKYFATAEAARRSNGKPQAKNSPPQ